MTTTPPEAPSGPPSGTADDGGTHHQGPRVTRDEVRDLGRLRRSRHDRKVAGVAGGLGRHLDVDPLVLRVAFVVLAFFGGAGLLLYGACWLLVPEDGSEEAPVTLDERSRTVALLVVGALAVFALIGDSWGVIWFPWPVAIVAVVVLVLLTRKDRRDHGAPRPGTAPPTPVPGSAAGATTAPYEWVPPLQTAPASYARPRDPRRRGPLLLWFTLALAALGVGILGMVDVAAADVPASAYVALVVATVGVMLLVGSVWGRAGGLVLVGLVATVALAATTAADNWEDERLLETPTSADQVRDRYSLGAGDLVLDLRSVADLERLDGRTLHLEGGIGELQVLVPDGLDLQVRAQVGGPGSVDFFGLESGGIATDVVRTRDDGDIDLTIDAQLGVGEITIDEERS